MAELPPRNSALALEWTILTVPRTKEVIGTPRAEINREAKKQEREHRVPLCDRRIEIFDEMATFSKVWLFPSRDPKEHISNMAMAECLRDLGDDATVHGFAVEIEQRLSSERAELAAAPQSSPGVNPIAEVFLARLCTDVEQAMQRLGFDSYKRTARGIEPRVDATAAKINVVMTDQSIITVGSFFFRLCGIVAKAFTRTSTWIPISGSSLFARRKRRARSSAGILHFCTTGLSSTHRLPQPERRLW